MKNNIYTLQATMDVLACCLAHELGSMSYMMTDIPRTEKLMYECIEQNAWERLPPTVQQAMIHNQVFQKVHVIAMECGFEAWELCGLRKHSKH